LRGGQKKREIFGNLKRQNNEKTSIGEKTNTIVTPDLKHRSRPVGDSKAEGLTSERYQEGIQVGAGVQPPIPLRENGKGLSQKAGRKAAQRDSVQAREGKEQTPSLLSGKETGDFGR